MSSNSRSIVFATLLCIVCSLMLTAASSGLKGFHQKNIRLDKQRNVLMSVGLVDESKSVPPENIEKLYKNNIESFWVNPSGRIVPEKERRAKELPIYLYKKNNAIGAYIIPINSRGLWGKIYGYLALKNDGKTISGFTVYKHSETPGLGGEIEKGWFQKNFVGKKIVDQSGDFVSISIAKGLVENIIPKDKRINYVDGISGATLTGKFLAAGMKEILSEYEPVSIKFRKNLVNK